MPADSAANALQAAIFAQLSQDAALTAATGAPRVYDDVPPGTPYPYITFGQSLERDWSTGTDRGSEHTITLHVWSRLPGRRQASELANHIRARLHDAAFDLAGHRLVNLRHEFSDARREPDGLTYHALLRFRAVTEAL